MQASTCDDAEQATAPSHLPASTQSAYMFGFFLEGMEHVMEGVLISIVPHPTWRQHGTRSLHRTMRKLDAIHSTHAPWQASHSQRLPCNGCRFIKTGCKSPLYHRRFLHSSEHCIQNKPPKSRTCKHQRYSYSKCPVRTLTAPDNWAHKPVPAFGVTVHRYQKAFKHRHRSVLDAHTASCRCYLSWNAGKFHAGISRVVVHSKLDDSASINRTCRSVR